MAIDEAAHTMHAAVPTAGLVITTFIALASMGTLTVCLSERLYHLKYWRTLVITQWLVLAIYIDSTLFVMASAILSHGFGLNSAQSVCSAAILLCITCYMSTKVMMYYFLVEKVYIVNGVKIPRMKSKLYLFNCFGMLLPYAGVVVLNLIWRFARFTPKGVCVIGMERKAMLPLIIFDVLVNVYLTALFILPLRNLYSYKHNPNSALRVITFRTFVGSLATLTSSVVNLTLIMVLNGEPAWICLMFCTTDILFSTVMLHWVTSKDNLVKTPAIREVGRSDTCKTCNPAHYSTHATAPFQVHSVGTGSEFVTTTISSSARASEDRVLPYTIFDKNTNGRRKSSTKGFDHMDDLEENPESVHVQTDITWTEEKV